MRHHITIVLMLQTLMFAIGCGSGGNTTAVTLSVPTQAVIKVSTVGTPSVAPLVGAQATVHLPAGVSVMTELSSAQTATGVVVASGMSTPADLVLGVYSAASGTIDAYVFKAAGFSAGEFAMIHCDIKAGSKLQVSDFQVSDLVVSDMNGNLITGLTPSIAVSFL